MATRFAVWTNAEVMDSSRYAGAALELMGAESIGPWKVDVQLLRATGRVYSVKYGQGTVRGLGGKSSAVSSNVAATTTTTTASTTAVDLDGDVNMTGEPSTTTTTTTTSTTTTSSTTGKSSSAIPPAMSNNDITGEESAFYVAGRVVVAGDSSLPGLLDKTHCLTERKKLVVEGTAYTLPDFRVDVGTVMMGSSSVGFIVQVEYTACCYLNQVDELILEFVDGLVAATVTLQRSGGSSGGEVGGSGGGGEQASAKGGKGKSGGEGSAGGGGGGGSGGGGAGAAGAAGAGAGGSGAGGDVQSSQQNSSAAEQVAAAQAAQAQRSGRSSALLNAARTRVVADVDYTNFSLPEAHTRRHSAVQLLSLLVNANIIRQD